MTSVLVRSYFRQSVARQASTCAHQSASAKEDKPKAAPSITVNVVEPAPASFDRAIGASALLRRNLAIYGLGGMVVPFIGIKLIDMVLAAAGLT